MKGVTGIPPFALHALPRAYVSLGWLSPSLWHSFGITFHQKRERITRFSLDQDYRFSCWECIDTIYEFCFNSDHVNLFQVSTVFSLFSHLNYERSATGFFPFHFHFFVDASVANNFTAPKRDKNKFYLSSLTDKGNKNIIKESHTC